MIDNNNVIDRRLVAEYLRRFAEKLAEYPAETPESVEAHGLAINTLLALADREEGKWK